MMPRWLWPFLASVCLVMVTAIWPMTDTSSLAPGVTAFENGAYDEALSLWETDQPSPAVLRNRAIVHLETGRPLPALADLRTALERSPRDPVLLDLLGEARRQLDATPPEPALAAPDWTRFITPDELLAIAMCGWCLCAGLTWFWWFHAGPIVPVLGLTLAGLLCTGLGLRGLEHHANTHIDVVGTNGAQMRVLPRPEAAVSSRLPGGTEVRVETTRGGFARVRTGEGSVGWVPASTLLLAQPTSNESPAPPATTETP